MPGVWGSAGGAAGRLVVARAGRLARRGERSNIWTHSSVITREQAG
jgi:hypothetical protein